jgi:DNA primase
VRDSDTGSSSLFLDRTAEQCFARRFGVTRTMPGVRFQEVRSLISMAQVLDLLGFVVQETSTNEVRGPCPVHGSTSPTSRSFSANLTKNVYRCFRCGSAGNHLDLYAAATHQSLYAAAIELCGRIGCEVPWI